MLHSLSITNVVLIDHLLIEFESGLCVLTGETGAGKSVLLDALGLALGVRAESGLVRKGEKQATVTASFQLHDNHTAYDILNRADIHIEDDVLLLRRVLYENGKSRAFINDHPVSITLLKKIGDTLVEIHGQFETQGLLNPQTHRAMLDEYAKVDNGLRTFWNTWKAEEDKLEHLKSSAHKAREEEEYIRYSLEDLEKLAPQIGEEEELANLREQLKHKESNIEALSRALSALSQDSDPVQQAWAELDKIPDGVKEAIESLSTASSEIANASGLIKDALQALQDNDYNLEEIDDRLYALRTQARKHQCSVDDLPQKMEALQERLSLITQSDDVLHAQSKKCAAARASYIKEAQKISAKRKSTAAKLNTLVAKELAPLKLDKATFITHIEALDEIDWGPHGCDKVQFLVSTNPGRAPGPLHKIASGGEMSRFMLALKVIIAQEGSTHSFIFDEIDTGIGGATADAVGERLARLAASKQVLVVTHAPQVAARANHHWIVSKGGVDDVKTDIILLQNRAERCEEIARMLAGADITDEARAAAKKLMDYAA